MWLEADRRPGPVNGGSPDGLDDPGRQAGKVLCNPPVARRGSGVDPGKLPEAFPLVVDIIIRKIASARLQSHDTHALLRQLVGKHTATGARSDHDDNRVVIQVKWCSHGFLPKAQSQLMSLKPRSM